MTTSYDQLHASIAGGLVNANLSFNTLITQAADQHLRIFVVPYNLLERDNVMYTITGYVADMVLVALSPLCVVNDARRHEIADAIVNRMPFARLLLNPSGHVAPPNTVWIEAAVPLPPPFAQQVPVFGEPIPPWLAVSPFTHAAAATKFVLTTFPEVSPVPNILPPRFGTEVRDMVPHSVPPASPEPRTPTG